jgi:hypothetical protein
MNPQLEQVQQMGNLWLETMTKLMSAAVATDATQPPPDAARQLRDASLGAMGEQVDKYMRSPQFLDVMKRSLDAQISFRKQMNQFLTDAHHSVQGVAKADVEALSDSFRQMERRVLDRIETLCERVEKLSERLHALDADKARGGGDGGDNHGNTARAADPAATAPGEELVEPGME